MNRNTFPSSRSKLHHSRPIKKHTLSGEGAGMRIANLRQQVLYEPRKQGGLMKSDDVIDTFTRFQRSDFLPPYTCPDHKHVLVAYKAEDGILMLRSTECQYATVLPNDFDARQWKMVLDNRTVTPSQ